MFILRSLKVVQGHLSGELELIGKMLYLISQV